MGVRVSQAVVMVTVRVKWKMKGNLCLCHVCECAWMSDSSIPYFSIKKEHV